MSSGLKILTLAEALAAYSATRQTMIARNVAHADTPGWRARDLVPFSETFAAESATGAAGAFFPKATRPGHATSLPAGGADAGEIAVMGAESPNGNSVSLEDQMVRASETRMQHEMSLAVWKKSLDILRTSLGAPR